MKPNFIVITISKETHRQLINLPWVTDAKSTAVYNDDGTVSFPIGCDTKTELDKVHADPDRAVQIMLGLKTN